MEATNPGEADEVGSNDENNMPELEEEEEIMAPEVLEAEEDEENDDVEMEQAEEDDEEVVEEEEDEGPALILEEEEEEEEEEEGEEIEGTEEIEEEVEENEDEIMPQVPAELEVNEEEEEEVEQEENEQVEEEEEAEEENEDEYEESGNPHVSMDEVSNDKSEENISSVPVQTSRVKGDSRKRSASVSSSDDGPRRKQVRSSSTSSNDQQQQQQQQAKAGAGNNVDRTHDRYCWVCHKDGVYFNCKICPRSYHMRCICLPDYPEPTLPEGDGTSKVCICPECVVVMNAEEVDKRSDAMKQLSMDQLVSMLKQICGRMKATPGAEPFLKPVQASDACDYFDYIVYPMDIQTLEKNVKQRQYGSTEAFLADAQWIVHNSIIFNSSASPYTASAKRILKVCKQELAEIETCPECYTNAHTKSDVWFVEACKRPHILVWAKLKGFPFWPAKAMKIKDDQVDVRFFGQHDRAWVNLKDCFLYSEEMPAAPPKKNAALLSAIEELNTHVERLTETHGEVLLAKAKTPLGRELSTAEIQRLLPHYKPETSAAKSEKDKLATTPKSGGMTITISSIKTNPTIVSNSVSDSSPSAEAKKVPAKLKRGSGSNATAAVSETRPTTRSAKASLNSTNATATPAAVVVSENSSSNTNPEPEQEEEPEEKTADSPSESESALEKEVPSKSPPATTAPPASEEPAKEEPNKIELEDDFESRVPSGEILASALGLTRITRRPSQSGSTKSEDTSTNKKDDSETQLQQQLKKVISRVSVTPVVESVPPETDIRIKTEPEDRVEEDDGDTGMEEPDKVEISITRSKAQDFMEHISSQAQTKPGYRFNISKDISISAIGQDAESESDNNSNGSISSGNNSISKAKKSFTLGSSVTVNVQRPSVSVQPTKQVTQLNQSLISQRPKLAQALQQPLQQGAPQRFLASNKDIRNLTRMLKPAMSPSITSKAGAPGVAPVRAQRAVPGAIQMSAIRGSSSSILQKLAKDGSLKQQQPIVVDSTSLRVDNPSQFALNAAGQLQKVGSSIQVNQVQSVQGAITLPGGTITVTPLSLQGGAATVATTSTYTNNSITINGERSGIPLKTGGNHSNGLPLSSTKSSTIVTTAPVLKTGKQASNIGSAAARKVTNMVPPTVVQTVQNLQKNVNELIRVAAEAIAVDMVEHAANKSDGDKNYKLENEKLLMKHTKELAELRHSQELMMRELRLSMEAEKKRALVELRRQMEMEKQKAVEEAKRKQWCAHCLREALFYCCWNTSYCGYSCQENHWPTHMATCTQNSASGTGGVENSSR